MSDQQMDLEAAKLLALRSKLTTQLTNQIARLCYEFLDNPEVKTLDENAQISCVYSAFISLWTHYKFNHLMPIMLDQSIVRSAEEIVKLEEQFGKGLDNGKGEQEAS